MAQAEDETVSGEKERPEEKRAFLTGPERGELIRSGKVAIAVMKDVGNGEVVAECGDHKGQCREEHAGEDDDSGAARGFTDAIPEWVVFVDEREEPAYKRIEAQREGEQQCKTTDESHVGRTPSHFFRKRRLRQPGPARRSVSVGRSKRKWEREKVARRQI